MDDTSLCLKEIPRFYNIAGFVSGYVGQPTGHKKIIGVVTTALMNCIDYGVFDFRHTYFFNPGIFNALQIAMAHKLYEIVVKLINEFGYKCINFEPDESGYTVLDIACYNENKAIVIKLAQLWYDMCPPWTQMSKQYINNNNINSHIIQHGLKLENINESGKTRSKYLHNLLVEIKLIKILRKYVCGHVSETICMYL
jgi:ankyrin repeat protein